MKCTFYLTDRQLEALKLLGLTPEENEKKHKFEDGDKYYFISLSGAISDSTWTSDNLDLSFESIGNCFDNIEDARFALEQLKVIHELKKYTTKPVWVWNQKKWYSLLYDNNTRTIRTEVWLYDQMLPNSMYFESKEMAQKAIDEIGEERLKKYWFEIEE